MRPKTSDEGGFLLSSACRRLFLCLYMQLDTPKVVAIAVKMEMAICKMVFQVSFFIIVVFSGYSSFAFGEVIVVKEVITPYGR